MSDSDYLEKGPCPECGSSDACATYTDGHAHCFSCGQHFDEFGVMTDSPKQEKNGLLKVSYKPIVKRGLEIETCRKYGYGLGDYKGEVVHVAPYYDKDGVLVAQKIRTSSKDFRILGDAKKVSFFGQTLWRSGGKRLIITEGEIDCLSVAQAMGLSWPVVSVPNGAQGAAKTFRQELEWLQGFEEVIIWFDSDMPGQKAARECAELLPPGVGKIVHVEAKDANELLLTDGNKAVVNAVWEAKTFRPDGLIDGRDITLSGLLEQIKPGYSTPYPALDEMTGGIRAGELTLLTAGTGVGKSTLARELGYHFNCVHNLRIGNIYLEESYKKTAQAYIAIDNDTPLGKLRKTPELLTDHQWETSLKKLIGNGRTFFYNHFGSLESDNLIGKMRYLAVSCGVEFIFLDHISIVVSGLDSSREGERKDIDILVTRLRGLIEETGIGVIAIAHLAKSQGTSHEEGGRVTLNDLRGSAILKQVPDTIIAMERNQQAEDPNASQLRLLKNRENGTLGIADPLVYSPETGRLKSVCDVEAAF